MIELPESYVLADQLNQAVAGKVIMNAIASAFPHKFAWYTGDPGEYHDKLAGRSINRAFPGTGYTCGGNTELLCGDMLLVFSTPIKYHEAGDKLPAKHQLLIEFEDFSHLSATVQMWGAIFCYPADGNGIPDKYIVNKTPTPLEKGFDEAYFEGLLGSVKRSISVKAFLATEQRIPGLGNGSLQDILFNAGVNPKTKLDRLSDAETEGIYRSIKSTLFDMTAHGGRDTEKDLFGCNGGYETILSSKTVKNPCPVCGGAIIREAYLGGNVYYCPVCQELRK